MLRIGSKHLTPLFVITLAVAAAAQVGPGGQTPVPEVSPRTATFDESLRQLLELPAPTPRALVSSEEKEARKKRPPDFYDRAKPPPDDAPVEDLVDYWERWVSMSEGRVSRMPSDAVRERLLAACEAAPERLSRLVSLLPDTTAAADRVKRLYDDAQGSTTLNQDWHQQVREWLTVNSKYFLDDLLAQARKVRDRDGYVENETALTALAKVDPDTAAPMLQALAVGGQPRTAAVALALLYRHARDVLKDAATEESYRANLQAIAADHNLPADARDTAIEALSLAEWPGRDDWYLALFADETLLKLRDGYQLYNPLMTLFSRDPDQWIPVMTKLVESKDRVVQQNAANCLVRYATNNPRRDAILPVLRWLSDPEWLDINSTLRVQFVLMMNALDIPESVPGLIWIVENQESERTWAAQSLAHYKDPRAIPALKRALAQEKYEGVRQSLIQGLLASGGLTEMEQLDALEAYAARLTTAEGREAMQGYSVDGEPFPLPISIGRYLAQEQEVPDALARMVLARADSLQRRNPAKASALLSVVRSWQAKPVELDILRRIEAGTADADTLANALERRARLRENVGPELQSLAGAAGPAQAVAAVLLEDEGLAEGLLGAGDERTQFALLVCARLVQMPLPILQVGMLLRSRNTNLAQAAERYLLAEDSRDAHQLLWEHHPQQAFIAGWREQLAYFAVDDFSAMGRAEEKLRAELFRQEDAPLGIFALLENDERPVRVLRIYPKRAVYTRYEDDSRYRERIITIEELERFKNFIASDNLLEKGPQFKSCHDECQASEFLALARPGGQRVFSYQGSDAWAALLANLDLFERHGIKIHYRLEAEIKGLEILFANDALTVKDVWQRGDDLRVIVEREPTPEEMKQEEEERALESDEGDMEAWYARLRHSAAERARARVSWRPLKQGKLGAATSQPEGYSTVDPSRLEIDNYDFPSELNEHLAQSVAGDSVVLAGRVGEGGLWKKAPGVNVVRIGGEGAYANPLVTPDGEWVVAAKAQERWTEPSYVIRFNLKTGAEYRVNLAAAEQFTPVAYIAAHGQVLLRRARNDDNDKNEIGPAHPEFYLLDAATGRTQLVTGLFEPLLEDSQRFLQPTSTPGEFWAAIPDQSKNQTSVGRYNLKDFSFRALLVVPHLTFNSASMWADEAGSKLYIVYEGQLLRIPLLGAPPSRME